VAHPGVGGARLRAEVHGSKGMLCIERTRGVGDPKAWVTVQGAQGDKTKLETLFVPYFLVKDLDLSSEDALISALNRQPFYAARRFVEAVLGNREPSPSLYDGAKCQAVLDAAVKSSETGRWMTVAQI
jgi:predicted dehydrogenase